MNTFEILPEQGEPTDGWTVDYSFLNEVRYIAYRDYGEDVHLEGVEAVSLAVLDALGAYFPNGLIGKPVTCGITGALNERTNKLHT